MPARTPLLLSILYCSLAATAQPAPQWQALPDAPFVGRHNDVYFVDPDRGWIVNGDGEIYATPDGGATWTRQLVLPAAHFRSVGFFDAAHGWAGNVGLGEFGTTDPTPLYGTADGGATWTPQTTFDGPAPIGLCGMQVVDDSTIVAVGRVRGPAFFVRTTDRGATWQSANLNAHAAGLIDVYFFGPDTGFAVGLTHTDHEQSRAVVLATVDGGATWSERFTSGRTGEWAWKLSFPSRQVGYVSLQRNSRVPIYILKTTDGGATWDELLFSQNAYFVQGIGFVDERHGWIGGNSTAPVFETRDGGLTWTPDMFRPRLNRFRFLGDSLGYAVGRTVYKYAPAVPVASEAEHPVEAGLRLEPNHPNPFDVRTTLDYTLPHAAHATLAVHDLAGRRVRVLVDALRPAGAHAARWDGRDADGRRLAPGAYLGVLRVGAEVRTRMLVLLGGE